MIERSEVRATTAISVGPRVHTYTRLLVRLRRNRSALFGTAIAVGIATLAAVAPLLPLAPPDQTHFATRLAGPLSPGYLLGSDQLGRDLLSRVIWGSRTSLVVGIGAALLALVAGSLLGVIAAYYGGHADNLLMRGIDVLMGFPEILLAIAIVAALGPGLTHAMVGVALANVPFYARGVRSTVLMLRTSEFIDAARAAGAKNLRIITRHLLPNIIGAMAVFVSLNVGWMLTETAGLSFIGLGAQPPTPDWGTMLADGRGVMTVAPHVATVPGAAIVLAVLGLNLLGEGLRQIIDPRGM
jgi:peptide/nickel transport system permease protein